MPEAGEIQQMMMGAFEEVQENRTSAPEGYEIIKELDRGGMAVVYLARQLVPLREVALKVVLPRFASDESACERMKREGRAMAALEHPGILPVYQVGEWNGLAYIIMKFAGGGTLGTVLKEGLPSVEKATEWLIASGEAVQFAHERGVIHRDLKPANIMIEANKNKLEMPKIIDFGSSCIFFGKDVASVYD